ncbi:cytochrome c [Thiocapsa rosea]|uniref:Cytochrome c n=1 Tax=Thiocapsa rosea TaxID=69360 RepID=A0A495VEW2_9GAMM|nr:cytochrome c [Thiocapsa rosea]RKT47380.1 cytochrome c' [Thiocapsa rosea]
MPIAPLFLALLLRAFAVEADSDARQLVELPPPMSEHMLANMRDHLLAIEQITRSLADGRYEEAAEMAEERLGMTAMRIHGAHHMAPHMPEGMRAIGSAMHRAASRFALAARDAEVSDDLASAFAGLSEVMGQCVACHSAYRVH